MSDEFDAIELFSIGLLITIALIGFALAAYMEFSK